jgi:hypothetical protein
MASGGRAGAVAPGSSGTSATAAAGTGSSGVGAVGTAGTGSATAGADGAAGSGVAAGMPKCLKKASQVIVMGDTYVLWAEGFLDALKTEAGQTFRNYALEGAGLGSVDMTLGPNLIPPEFDQALSADPDIIAAIMIGGGTDILLPDPKFGSDAAQCKTDTGPTLKVCQMIMALAFETGAKLFQKMADSGVGDLVLFFYPHVPKNTLIGGANPNAMLDYGKPMAKAMCDTTEAMTGGKLRCHFLDLVPIFEGHADWFQTADVHPNKMGSTAMAKAIVMTMKDNCVAQPASSGCCTP